MFTYRDGSNSKEGDIIRWFCWDSDDYTTWTFTGIVKKGGIMYLGGGIDFGGAFGKMMTFAEVIVEADANDPDESGIIKVGEIADLVRLIGNWED